MTEKKLTTLLDIIKYSANLLSELGIKDSRLNVELMFCEILKCDRMRLYLDFDKPLKQEEISAFKTMLRRRMQYEPLQYILGYTNFYGYKISVDKNVLIPRQETEILADKILEDIYQSNSKTVNILEIGSGSGCLAVAICGELTKKGISYTFKSIDISSEAIKIAEQNSKSNNIGNIEFFCEDYFYAENKYKFDYVVSNPPYIPEEDINNLDKEIKQFEPLNALTDRGDGLSFYKKIIGDYFGKSKIFFEIGDGLKSKIENILNYSGVKDYTFYKDYCNIDRVLKIK